MILAISTGISVFVSSIAFAAQVTEIDCRLSEGLQGFLKANPGPNKYATMTASTVNNFRSTPATVKQYQIKDLSALAEAKDITILDSKRNLPIRIYRPLPLAPAALPLILYFHGGGWSTGTLASQDAVARALASKVNAVVASVDYRLAPENPYPSSVEDAEAAVKWAILSAARYNADPKKIIIMGESAGGNLATVAARHTLSGRLALQVLFYPSVDISNTDSRTYREFGDKYLVTRAVAKNLLQLYAPKKSDWSHPDISPINAKVSELANLPPTLMIVNGCDPIQDEDLRYAQKLRDAKVRVEILPAETMIHGFLDFYNQKFGSDMSPDVDKILDQVAKSIQVQLIEASKQGKR